MNFNIHFHILFLDGVFVVSEDDCLKFVQVKALSGSELRKLIHALAHRIGRPLERQGLLERDAENSYLTEDYFDQGR